MCCTSWFSSSTKCQNATCLQPLLYPAASLSKNAFFRQDFIQSDSVNSHILFNSRAISSKALSSRVQKYKGLLSEKETSRPLDARRKQSLGLQVCKPHNTCSLYVIKCELLTSKSDMSLKPKAFHGILNTQIWQYNAHYKYHLKDPWYSLMNLWSITIFPTSPPKKMCFLIFKGAPTNETVLGIAGASHQNIYVGKGWSSWVIHCFSCLIVKHPQNIKEKGNC